MSRDYYKVDVPEGQSGAWCVSRFTVTPEASRLDAVINTKPGYFPVSPGTYTKLTNGSVVVMSDTHSEYRDHVAPINRAQGHVLIAGLGIGMVLKAVLAKPVVKRVTVVEKSPDVIKLVAPSYRDKRVEIIEADIFTWEPPKGMRYDVAWFDIWDDVSEGNLPEMTKLLRKFGRRAAWKGCWRREWLLYMRRRGM